MNEKIRNFIRESAKYKYIYLTLLVIVIITESLSLCYSGILYQADRFGISIIEPLLNDVKIVMGEDWVPILKHDLSKGTEQGIFGLQFNKVKTCSVIGTVDIQNFLANENEKENLRNISSSASYPWGEIHIRDHKSENGWFTVYLLQYNIAIFTPDLSFLDEIIDIKNINQT